MIFIENKYTRIYYSIISNAQTRALPKDTYSERHHVIPKSLGGSDEKDNLVKLTAREHFICHILLPKMTCGQARHKMLRAVMIMRGFQGRERYINNRLFETVRIEYSKYRSTTMSGSGNHRFGIPMSEETKRKISAANHGRSLKGKYQPLASDETKLKMRKSAEKGCHRWWTNGIDHVRQIECPGPGWERGRLKSSMSEKMIGKKPLLRKWDIAIVKELSTGSILEMTYEELALMKATYPNTVGQELVPRKRAHLSNITHVVIEKRGKSPL